MGIYFNRDGETCLRDPTTDCWYCHDSYDLYADKCPSCGAINAFLDLAGAQAQRKEWEGQ